MEAVLRQLKPNTSELSFRRVSCLDGILKRRKFRYVGVASNYLKMADLLNKTRPGLPSQARLASLWNEARLVGAAAAEAFRMDLRGNTWRPGQIFSTGAGTSLDYKDHRHYVPGDDPRHINWQAYARTDQPTMKVFHQESAPLLDLYVDCSASMFLHETKARRTLELLAFCLENARRSGGPAKLYLRDRGGWEPQPPGDPDPGSWNIAPPGAPGENVFISMNRAPRRTGSTRIWISDFLEGGFHEETWGGLGPGRVLMWVPYTADEADPDWRGWVELVDCETADWRVRQVEPDFLHRYREHYQRHFELLREAAVKRRFVLARLPCGNEFKEALRTCGEAQIIWEGAA